MTLGTLFDFFKFFFFSLGKDATNTLITVAGSLLGVWAGSIISRISSRETIIASNKNAIDLMQRQEFNKAAAQFRNSFLGTILFLEDKVKIKGTGTSDKINEFLGALIFIHMKALTRFKPFLDVNERIRINNAWDEYCHPNGVPKDENKKRDFRFNDYKSIEDSEGNDKAREIALQKINKILEFSNVK